MRTNAILRAAVRTIWFALLALAPFAIAACSQNGGGGPAY
jgi:hypothetical protein